MYKSSHKNHSSGYDLYTDLEKIRNAVNDATQHAKNKAEDLFASSLEEVKDKTNEYQEDLATYIAKKPLESVAIALASGWFLGWLLNRKNSKS